MNNSTPLLSIVIPTKNRYYYLKILVETLLSENFDEFEIIIQDNSDSNSEIVNFIESYKSDNRLKYNYTSGWLSIIENCDLGVKAASGDYICMLGDDDGILINKALITIDYMKNNSIDAALVKTINYNWKGTTHAIWGNSLSERAFVPSFSNNFLKLDIKKEFSKTLGFAGAYGPKNIPGVYHNIIAKNVLDNLIIETGTYFPGPSPDMANAVGISKHIHKAIIADFPIVIAGHSPKSGGGMGSSKTHLGNIEKMAHLPKSTKADWDKNIPLFWSGPTIYAESLVKALIKTNRSTEKVNFFYLYVVCWVYEPFLRNLLKKYLFSDFNSMLVFFSIFIKISINRYVLLFCNLFKYKFYNYNKIKCNSIYDLVAILNKK